MAARIQISLALVTRNRPGSLRRALHSLRAQSVQPFEVVVSDDSSNSRFQEASKSLAVNFDCRYVRGPQRGLYANRNHAALACRGSHIRTMDDDHTFPEEHFDVVERWVKNHPQDVLVIGEFNPKQLPVAPPPPIPGQLHPRGYSISPRRLADYYGISCGGSVYPRSIFDSGYRFEESFLFGSSYLEFGSLLKSKGYTMRFIDDTFLIHHFEHADLRRDHITTPSLICTIICHSWAYQPSLSARILSVFQLSAIAMKRRSHFYSEFRDGFRAAILRMKKTQYLPHIKDNPHDTFVSESPP